jgi:CRP/FNR family transcriptional regulator
MERHVAPIRLGQRETLHRSGQWPAFIYGLREGSLKLVREIGPEGGTVVETVFPGEWIGFSSSLAGEHFQVNAEALEPSALCAVRREDFLEQFYQGSHFSRVVVRQITAKLDQAQTLLLMRSQHDAASRLASCLLFLDARRPASVQPGVVMTKSDLGQMIATAQETVFRLLAKFERQGLLRRKDRRIVLMDLDGLRTVAGNAKNTGPKRR